MKNHNKAPEPGLSAINSMTRDEPKEELVAALNKYRTVADFTYDWEYWIDPQGNMVYTSPSCERLTGYAVSEFMEDPLLMAKIAHPLDKNQVEQYFKEKDPERKSTCLSEFRIIHKGGAERWIGHEAQPVFSESGQFSGMRGSNRDITIQKITNAELLRNKTFLDKTGKLARVGGWEMDLKAGSLYWSETTHLIHEVEPGFTPDLETAINFYAPESIPVITNYVERAIQLGESFDCELKLITAKKNQIWVRAIGEPQIENGETVKVGGVFQDISRRKKLFLEQELARQKLALHVKQTPLGVVEFNNVGIITEWNASAEKIFGLSRSEAVGKEWTILVPERSQDKIEGVVDSIIDQKGGLQSTNVNKRKDGKEITCEWFNTPLIDAANQTIGIASLVMDITERVAAEIKIKKHKEDLEKQVKARTKDLNRAIIELKESNQDLEQFAYVASHDLQEPLRMVSSYTQLLGKRYYDKLDDDARDFINYAVDGATRMQRLINDLLEYSRVTTRGKKFDRIDLSYTLGQALVILQNRIETTGALVTNDDLPFAIGDEMQIIRVFQNLIDNAIKFRGEDSPKIHISSTEDQNQVTIAVKDNGLGIEEAFSDRVFTIFQRLNHTKDYPGTGIGLAVCKRAIERHGGKLWFESEPGEGTTFYFTLPKNMNHERQSE